MGAQMRTDNSPYKILIPVFRFFFFFFFFFNVLKVDSYYLDTKIHTLRTLYI